MWHVTRKLHFCIEIEGSAQAVYGALTDPAQLVAMHPLLERYEDIEAPTPQRRAIKFFERLPVVGAWTVPTSYTTIMRMTQPDQRMDCEVLGVPGISHMQNCYELTSNGGVIVLEERVTLSVFKLFERYTVTQLRNAHNAMLDRLKKHIESGSGA